jgi:hypothetical protein
MYPFVLTVEINAPILRVWRALCDPHEVLAWDPGLEAALDAPDDYPRPGQHVKWRCRSGPFHVLHDRPQEVEGGRRLRSLLALGPYRYDETYMLEAAGRGCRLTVAVSVWMVVPVVHSLFELLYLGPATQRAFTQSLAAIKSLCETEPFPPG